MAHFNRHFLHTLLYEFVIESISRALQFDMHGHLWKYRYAKCAVGGLESKEHYICHCAILYEIRGRYHCPFKQGFGSLCKVTRKMVLGIVPPHYTTTTHQQRTMIYFFSSINLSQYKSIKGYMSRVSSKKIDWTIAMCHACRQQSFGSRPLSPL